MSRFSLQQLVGNIKFIGTLVVLVLAISLVALRQTPETGAFLASGLRNIRMGVGTDQWQPPMAPQVLGFAVVAEGVESDQSNSDQNDQDAPELLTCGSVIDAATVELHWQDAENQVTPVESFWVGMAAEPKQTQVSAEQFRAPVILQEGVNEFVVTAVDARDESSQPTECRITLDTVAPVVELVKPNAVRANQAVEIEAKITELNTADASIEITNEAGEAVIAGEMVLADPSDTTSTTADSTENTQTISTVWSTESMADGSYTIKVLAKDKAGNQAEKVTSIIIDHQAPESTITMNVPGAHDAGLFKNAGLEAGLTDWTTQGDVSISGLSGSATKPKEGALSAVLGRSNQNDQVSFLSQDLSAVTGQVKTVGFWYYLNPVAAGAPSATPTEGMSVFVDEEMVHQEWLGTSAQTAAWRYLEIDVAAAADPSITIAYYHDNDSTTGGELYVDSFAVNQPLELKNITVDVTAKNSTQAVDAGDHATAFIAYTLSGNEVVTSQLSTVSLPLTTMPDDQQIRYWAVDSVGNREQAKTTFVPTITKVAAKANAGQPSDQNDDPSDDQPATDSGTPAFSATLNDLGDYRFKLNLENAKPNDQVDFTVVYRHGGDQNDTSAQSGIQEAVQGQVLVGSSATTATADGLYFGTCSSTVGEVCTPHLNVRDILVELLVTGTDATTTEYEVRYPGMWTTTLTENNNANI